MKLSDYENEQPRGEETRSGGKYKTERKLCHLLFLCFGILCIIQATLNVSLRLALHTGKESTHSECNATHFSDQNPGKVEQDCERRRPKHCNELQERFNALTREKNLLENRNNILANMLRMAREERDGLLMKLRELTPCVASQRCPPNWTKISFSCYFLSTEARTWENSRKHCQSEDADLVVIDNEQEQRALYQLGGDAGLLFWIGLYDTSGKFKWVDGSALTNSFWSGQPGDGNPNNRKDCVEMNHAYPLLSSWTAAPCGVKRRWLCEKVQFSTSLA